ncbi:MAG: kelch repeat-containing protein [Bacteroides sp.]|nr:kelch repeat-containing protein [Bacteroides sp.]
MNRLLLLGMMLLATVTVFTSCSDDDYTQGRWYRMASFNGYQRSQACSFTIDDKGYLCCGFRGANNKYLNDLWIYDMDNNSWTQGASLPDTINGSYVGGRYAGVGFAVNGKGYVTTGRTKDGSDYTRRKDTWEYDPNTDSWTQKDDFAGVARDGALAFCINNTGYVGTGFNDDDDTEGAIGYFLDFYSFDPDAAEGSQWQVVTPSFPGEARRDGTAFVINNEAYICCGIDQSVAVVDFYKFDGTTWTKLRDIADTNDDEDYDDDYAIARYGAVSFVIDGYGFIATGYRSGNTNDYWLYNPDTDLWYGDSDDDFTTLADVANYASGASSRSYAVSFSTGSRGFLLTGTAGSSSYLSDMYELKPGEEEEQ